MNTSPSFKLTPAAYFFFLAVGSLLAAVVFYNLNLPWLYMGAVFTTFLGGLLYADLAFTSRRQP